MDKYSILKMIDISLLALQTGSRWRVLVLWNSSDHRPKGMHCAQSEESGEHGRTHDLDVCTRVFRRLLNSAIGEVLAY